MPTDEHHTPVDVFALLIQDEHVLFTRRAGNIPGSGQWALPSGRLEAGEDVVTAIRRELHEELGIAAIPAEISSFGVTHARPPGGNARLGLGFLVSRWTGEPEIREPEKCSALIWRPITAAPEPMMGYTRLILRLYTGDDILSLAGWE